MNSNERFPNSDENLNIGEDKIEIFSSNGFLLLKSFITNDEVEEYLNRINTYIDQICPQLPEEEVFYEVKNNPSSLKHSSAFELFRVSSMAGKSTIELIPTEFASAISSKIPLILHLMQPGMESIGSLVGLSCMKRG